MVYYLPPYSLQYAPVEHFSRCTRKICDRLQSANELDWTLKKEGVLSWMLSRISILHSLFAAGDTWPGRSRSNFRSWFTILAASELISSVLGEIQYEILPIIISKYISKSDTYFSVIFDLKLMDVNTALNVENSLSYTKNEEVLDNSFNIFV